MQLKNLDLLRQQSYINGQWLDAYSRENFAVINPFNQEVIIHVANCGKAETDLAINSADAAWPAWQALTAYERRDILLRWGQLIQDNIDDLALLITSEQGKPLKEAKGEMIYALSYLDWFANEAIRLYGDQIPSPASNKHFLVHKQAIGVVAAITPWNFPAAMLMRKCAPALAVGCCMIAKPAEDTPLTALALAVLAEQAGLPAGVLNIITGSPAEIGQALTAHPSVRKLSFTGSTAVGKLLMQQSAATVKKLSLELGGNAPFIVFADADLDAAITGLLQSKFRNAGQTCVSPNRIYLHHSIHEQFCEKLRSQMQQLRLGNGIEPATDIGPLINFAAMDKVKALVTDAINQGATCQLGGKADSRNDLCYLPTLLTGVKPTMRIAREEIFSPVVAVQTFSDEASVLRQSNATDYGLASYFYTQDLARVWRVSEGLQFGIISINEGSFSHAAVPFGGCKESGFGREGSKYGMDEYIYLKYLCLHK